MDLSWFEQQWLNRKENPVLRISDHVSSKGNKKELILQITQENSTFKLPLDIDITTGDR